MSPMQQAVKETQELILAIQQAQQSMLKEAVKQQAGSANGLNQIQVTPDDLLAMERTKLANERTRLANQRTLLSYIRTALGFFATAVSLIQFFENKRFVITGYIFIPLGLIFLLIGFFSYYRTSKIIRKKELIP